MNILRPILSPILQQSIFNERYVYDFDGIDDFISIPEVVVSPTFEIAVEFSTTTTTGDVILDMRNTRSVTFGSPGFVLGFNASQQLKIWYEGGVTVFQPIIVASGANDGQPHKIRIVNGANLDVFYDGQLALSSQTAINVPFSPNQYIGTELPAGAYFEGLIYNTSFIDAGTLIRNYPINDNSDVIRDTVTDNGPQEVVNGTFDIDSDWAKGAGWTISGGAADCDGTQVGLSPLTQSETLVSGLAYTYSYDVTFISAGTVQFNVAGNGQTEDQPKTQAGHYSGVFIHNDTGTGDYGFLANADFVGSVDNLSVRRSLGPELVVNGSFDTDTVWIKGAGWSISGGSAIKSGGGASFLTQTGILTPGTNYLVEFISQTTPSINVVLGGDFFTVAAPNIGSNFVVAQCGAGNDFEFQGGADYEIDFVSVRQADGYGTLVNGNPDRWEFKDVRDL